jgi:peptidylprolyl isomerase
VKTKLALAIAAATVSALVLAGCSSAGPDASASPSPTTAAEIAQAKLQAEADAALAKVKWEEDANGVPTVTYDMPFKVGVTSARVVADGDGAEITADQIASLNYVVTNGTDGTVQYSTYEEGRKPEGVTLTEGQIDPVLIKALVGSHVGVDFLYATPGSDDPAAPSPSVVMAVTVASAATPLERATGTAVTPPAGLPTVTLDAATGAPTVVNPTSNPPKDLVVQTLIKGDGKVVAEDDAITIHYTGSLWDGTKFDSSWDRGAPATFPLSKGQLIDGWVQGLAGQTVGSQVLLVIPPALGYGDKDSQDGKIPGGSTLVFVVDILAAS